MWSLSALIRYGVRSQDLLMLSLALLMLFLDIFFNYKQSRAHDDSEKIKFKHYSGLVTKYFFFPLFFIAYIYYVHNTVPGQNYIIKLAVDSLGVIVFGLTYYFSKLKEIKGN